MLVLSRKAQQQLKIGNMITITIIKTHGKSVRLGIEAPKDIRILRGELPVFESEDQSIDTTKTLGCSTVEFGSRCPVEQIEKDQEIHDMDEPCDHRHRALEGWTVSSMRQRVREVCNELKPTVK